MIEKYKTKVVMSKPICVGCAILDLSNLTMLQFHYNIIDQHFKTRYSMMNSDTDNFVYDVKHHDIHEWMKENNQ